MCGGIDEDVSENDGGKIKWKQKYYVDYLLYWVLCLAF